MTTMTFVDEAAAQLAQELGEAAHRIAVLAGPDAVADWPRRVAARAGMLAAQLAQEGDDNLAAETVVDVMCALWPHGDPDPEWWRTPVGRLCARSLGRDDAEAVTYSAAAAMLGVARGTVSTMVQRGQLDRHPDGGVARASVLLRIGDPPPRSRLA